ncbi:hypothetical protein JW711_01635 [Candidatus Woesearchaeota archaeon]|nr:hypothetical protein [Candidatus Woesearchaeota archaeon]
MIIEDKQIKEIRSRVTQYLKDGTIQTKSKPEHVSFFLANAKNSLNSANVLFDVSTKKDLQASMGFPNFDGYLWVINASYYSMFYTVRALLENEGLKLRSDLSIHLVTFDTMMHFFYITGKLEKRLVEYFVQGRDEAAELLGHTKAEALMKDYLFEKTKRGEFTYEMGKFAIESKARTSLERAGKFYEEITRIMAQKKP